MYNICVSLLCQFYVGLCTMFRAMIAMIIKLIKWIFEVNGNAELGRDTNFSCRLSH